MTYSYHHDNTLKSDPIIVGLLEVIFQILEHTTLALFQSYDDLVLMQSLMGETPKTALHRFSIRLS
ncbi:hypothetical protein [Moorena sp. SIO4G3]|uniref:hypothetical protein n=1 Tax=Moorena sp. SIO4G3 TaxID=2607821 RepID=UPI0025EAFAB6|nr:hypothetical protein [Moorena sp. SIO4G3]